jgi:hypothetical protein
MAKQEFGQNHIARINLTINNNELEKEISIFYKISFESMIKKSFYDHLNFLDNCGEARVWTFKCITKHQDPLTSKAKDWKGSKSNLMTQWENGEISIQPLEFINIDGPLTFAGYANKNYLLGLDTCTQFVTLDNARLCSHYW